MKKRLHGSGVIEVPGLAPKDEIGAIEEGAMEGAAKVSEFRSGEEEDGGEGGEEKGGIGGREKAAGAAGVEIDEREGGVVDAFGHHFGNEIAGEDEEDIDTEVAGGEEREAGVVEQDEENSVAA